MSDSTAIPKPESSDMNSTTDAIEGGVKLADGVFQKYGLIGLLLTVMIISNQVTAYLDRTALSDTLRLQRDETAHRIEFEERTDAVHDEHAESLREMSKNIERVAILLEQLLAKNGLSQRAIGGE